MFLVRVIIIAIISQGHQLPLVMIRIDYRDIHTVSQLASTLIPLDDIYVSINAVEYFLFCFSDFQKKNKDKEQTEK